MPKGQYQRKRKPLAERFATKYEIDENGCWLWVGSRGPNGYGRISVGGKRGGWALAHRVAWELYRGPIPEGLTIDHLCRVRHCVNPDHLEPVSHAENLRRGDGPPRGPRPWMRKTHCHKGHEYTPENTIIRPSEGYPRCRICTEARERARAFTRSARSQ